MNLESNLQIFYIVCMLCDLFYMHCYFIFTSFRLFPSSVRMNEREVRDRGDMKYMAYLVDWKTISVGKLAIGYFVSVLIT